MLQVNGGGGGGGGGRNNKLKKRKNRGGPKGRGWLFFFEKVWARPLRWGVALGVVMC